VVIHSPEDLYKNYLSLFKDHVRERFLVFWLSSSNKVLGFEVVSEGILNSSIIHPREVFRGSIIATAAAIIIAHNHPSENPEPSSEDITITRQIVEAGKIVGITVHDHMIFAGSTYTSFAERGIL
jgi:DNA repair protein RadC